MVLMGHRHFWVPVLSRHHEGTMRLLQQGLERLYLGKQELMGGSDYEVPPPPTSTDLNNLGGPRSSTGKLVWAGIPGEPINLKHHALSPLALGLGYICN